MGVLINILICLLVIVGIFLLSSVLNYLIFRFKYKLKRAECHLIKVKKIGVLKRLFWLFPRQLVYDYLTCNPDEFKEFGVRFICGEQGSGKTVFLTKYLLDLRKHYPSLKIQTNYEFKLEDEKIEHWQDLLDRNNGIYGYVNVLDEVQNWFNSLASKDFPPEMMTEISQQRKQRKLFLCTSQVFGRVAKPIREQAMLVYEPFTFFGCLTFVRCYKPVFDDTGTLTKKKSRGFQFFVHNKELREAYDTHKKVEKMAKKGFKSELEQIRTNDIPAESQARSAGSAGISGLLFKKK